MEKCLNLTHRQVSSFRFNDLHCVRFMSRFPFLRKILLDILYQDLRESRKSSEGGRKKQPSGRRRVDPRAVSRGSDGMRRGSRPPLLRSNLLPPASQPPYSLFITSTHPIAIFRRNLRPYRRSLRLYRHSLRPFRRSLCLNFSPIL